MKKKKCFQSFVFIATVLQSGVSFAQLDQKKVYFRVETGYSWTQPSKFKDDPAPAGGCVICAADGVTPVEINRINNTWLMGAGVGYKINDHLRSDVTFSYRGGYELSDHDGAGNSISAKVKSNLLLFSGYYDFDALGRPNIKPYIGAGIGWVTNQIGTVGYVTAAGAASSLAGGTVNQLAWSGGFGVGIEISRGTIIDIGYRYVNLGKIQLGSQNALGVNPGYAASGKLMTNELFFGMRF